jgi:hypothetical protein
VKKRRSYDSSRRKAQAAAKKAAAATAVAGGEEQTPSSSTLTLTTLSSFLGSGAGINPPRTFGPRVSVPSAGAAACITPRAHEAAARTEPPPNLRFSSSEKLKLPQDSVHQTTVRGLEADVGVSSGSDDLGLDSTASSNRKRSSTNQIDRDVDGAITK